jgi:hypothetical protein
MDPAFRYLAARRPPPAARTGSLLWSSLFAVQSLCLPAMTDAPSRIPLWLDCVRMRLAIPQTSVLTTEGYRA